MTTGRKRPPKYATLADLPPLPPNADRFDRVCHAAIANYLRYQDEALWADCPDVESIPGKCSGAWCVKGTRIMVQGIIANAEAGCTAEEIAGPDIYPDLPVDQVRRILARFYGEP
jgi:uncharacterized protein (DUF433 family)